MYVQYLFCVRKDLWLMISRGVNKKKIEILYKRLFVSPNDHKKVKTPSFTKKRIGARSISLPPMY